MEAEGLEIFVERPERGLWISAGDVFFRASLASCELLARQRAVQQKVCRQAVRRGPAGWQAAQCVSRALRWQPDSHRKVDGQLLLLLQLQQQLL